MSPAEVEAAKERLMLLYGNAYEAKWAGKTIGVFATEKEARAALRRCATDQPPS